MMIQWIDDTIATSMIKSSIIDHRFRPATYVSLTINTTAVSAHAMPTF